nr:acidic cytochrome c3 [Desulfobacterales bacterium]
MRKERIILYVAITILISVFALMHVYAQEDVFVVEDSAFKDNRQRPPALFPHDEHNEKARIEECSVCHHVYQDGKRLPEESSEGQECSECHKLKRQDNVRPLMKAYHDMCRGCHQKRKVEAKKLGPVTCGECHPRKTEIAKGLMED